MAQECCNTDEKDNTKKVAAAGDTNKHEHKAIGLYYPLLQYYW